MKVLRPLDELVKMVFFEEHRSTMMCTCPPFPESRSCTSVAWKLDEGKVEDANDEDGDLLVLRIMLLILQPSSLAPAGAMLGRPARATLPLRLSLRMVMVMVMMMVMIIIMMMMVVMMVMMVMVVIDEDEDEDEDEDDHVDDDDDDDDDDSGAS